MLRNKTRNFAVGRRNRYYGPASGGNAVEFAGNDEPLEFRPERNPMNVRNAQRPGEGCLILIRHEAKHVANIPLPRSPLEFFHEMPAADEQKDNIASFPKALRRFQHRPVLMRPTEIARVADHEFMIQTPLLAQGVLFGQQGADMLIVAPVVNDVDPGRRDSRDTIRSPMRSPRTTFALALRSAASRSSKMIRPTGPPASGTPS